MSPVSHEDAKFLVENVRAVRFSVNLVKRLAQIPDAGDASPVTVTSPK